MKCELICAEFIIYSLFWEVLIEAAKNSQKYNCSCLFGFSNKISMLELIQKQQKQTRKQTGKKIPPLALSLTTVKWYFQNSHIQT